MAENTEKQIEVLMIGAGPTSLAAAVYTTREDLDTVLLEKGAVGGLAAITDRIENYPGFPEGVGGMELSQRLRDQAERFGAKIELGEVKEITDEGDRKRVVTTNGDYLARAILIGTGTDYRKLDIPGEEELFGRGVHYCATCDGPLYKDKALISVGGGNSSAQESLFLAKLAKSVDILIRGDKWKASDVLVERVENTPNINVHFHTTTDEIVEDEDGMVDKVIGTNKKTKKKVEFETDGVFVFVGLIPNTSFLKDSDVKLDENDAIPTNRRLETNVKGIFAAGDVTSGSTMQIASAVGEGATAALMIREYLEEGAWSNE